MLYVWRIESAETELPYVYISDRSEHLLCEKILILINIHNIKIFVIFIPSWVRSKDCLPAPRSDITPRTHGGTSFSNTGPILAHICNK